MFPRVSKYTPPTRRIYTKRPFYRCFHRWIFWAFHLNTNTKDARAHTGVRADSRGHTFPAKVSPPFLKKRVGVFSTRTPHRPNPIGVSLCKVRSWTAVDRTNVPCLLFHWAVCTVYAAAASYRSSARRRAYGKRCAVLDHLLFIVQASACHHASAVICYPMEKQTHSNPVGQLT